MAIPTIDMVRTGQNINRLRKLAGVSVKDLQDVFGFATPQAIYKWQHGTAMPTIDNLVVLAAVFGVTIDEILVVDDNTHWLGAADSLGCKNDIRNDSSIFKCEDLSASSHSTLNFITD